MSSSSGVPISNTTNYTSSSTGSSNELSSLAEPLIANPTNDDPLSLFLIQIIIILVLVRILAKILGRLRQPPVIGEIIAGILLGPSVFGYIPNFSTTIFPTSSLVVLNVFAQIGLIFFMFFLGLEVDIALLTRNWRAAAPIAITSIIIPFGCGVGISFWFYNIEPTTASQTTFLLFMGTSFSFTAFPVLARLLTSFRLLDAGVGVHTLSIAAIDDVLAWCVLAITLSYAGGGSAIQGVYTMLLVIAFVLVVVFVVRPFLLVAGLFFARRTAEAQAKGPGAEEFSRDYVALLFLLLACASIWTEIIGVHAFFGAFAFGVAVPKNLDLYAHEGIEHYGLVEYLAPKIELLVVEFFLPLYFANSGLSTQLGTLNTGELWGKAIALIVIATVAKMGPVTIMTRLTSTCFYVDTSDPEDPELMLALDNEQEVLAERQKMGIMESAPELELATVVRQTQLKEAREEAGEEDAEDDDLQAQLAKKHAEFADSGGMHRITISHMDAGGKPVDTVVEEKRLQDSPPPTGGSAVIVNTQPSEVEEMKEQEIAVVVQDDEDDDAKDREPSQQLSHRMRPQPRESVHFSDMHLHTDDNLSSPQDSSSAQNSPRTATSPPFKNKPVPIPWKVCFCIGVLMNTRGLVALIALNIGLQKGILGPRVFSLMVLMALVTTFITSPVFDYMFYRPYMKEKRQKREKVRQQLRREATQRKLIESGGKEVEDEPEETEVERLARLKLEEEEDDRLRDEELNRNTLMISGAFTPRAAQSYVPHSSRSASPPWSWSRAATMSNLNVITGPVVIVGQSNTVGAPSVAAREARGSLSGRQPASLYNLYQSQPSRAGLFNGPGSPGAAYHLDQDSTFAAHNNGLKTSSSVGSMAKLNRGSVHSSSMHSLMQTTPSRLNLQAPLIPSSSQSGQFSRASTPNSRDVVAEHGRLGSAATRHPSDTSGSGAGSGNSDGLTQTGPSRLHIVTATPESPQPVPSPTSAESNAVHSGPGRAVRHQRHMSDILESNAGPEDADAGRD